MNMYLLICIVWSLYAMIDYTSDVGNFSFKTLIAGIVNFIFCPIVIILRFIDIMIR
jgi:hypothetical protein